MSRAPKETLSAFEPPVTRSTVFAKCGIRRGRSWAWPWWSHSQDRWCARWHALEGCMA